MIFGPLYLGQELHILINKESLIPKVRLLIGFLL